MGAPEGCAAFVTTAQGEVSGWGSTRHLTPSVVDDAHGPGDLGPLRFSRSHLGFGRRGERYV